MRNNINRNNQGQVLVIVLLVILIALTIGLSIAGSSLKNVQQTAVLEESNRAFSAAEAGIEEALVKIDQGTPIPTVANKSLQSGSSIKNVQTTQQNSLQLSALEQDNVAQLDLACPTCGTGTLTVSWDSNTALLISKIYLSGGEYVVTRWALNCDFNPGNNFTSKSSGANSKCTQDIPINGTVDQVLRIRAMYADTSLTVSPVLGTSIPVQSVVVKSTGQSGEAERTVQVERSLPVPPSILDYTLFSASGSLSK
jgi:hypothetical protein